MSDDAKPMKGIRASALPGLFSCIRSLQYREGSVSNEYADTGSLIHAGIEAFHKLTSIDAALAVMAVRQSDFPEANAPKAAHHFRRYTETEKRWGTVTGNEMPIAFKLDPAPFDTTKEAIAIDGTLDQIRLAGEQETVVDAKTGAKPIKWMMRHYAPQLCAYQYGYYIATGRKPHAAILRTADFLSGGNVYHPVEWSWDTVLDVMNTVRVLVGLHRMGLKLATPGEHCDYCPAQALAVCSINAKPTEKGRYALPVATRIEDLF